jgi:hypothetical protein
MIEDQWYISKKFFEIKETKMYIDFENKVQ